MQRFNDFMRGFMKGLSLPVTFVAWLWGVFNGWKTRLVMLSGAILQLITMLDANMVSTAFKLNQQQAAAVALFLFVLGWLAREVAQKPGAIASVLQKRRERD